MTKSTASRVAACAFGGGSKGSLCELSLVRSSLELEELDEVDDIVAAGSLVAMYAKSTACDTGGTWDCVENSDTSS